MLVYQRVMGSNGFLWISIDLTCWSIWLAEMCTCQNWWSSITKVTEQNLNGILPAGSLSTTKRSKEALGIYPQWIMNLNPQNGWLLVFFWFFWCEITSFKAWCQIRSRRDVGICPMEQDSWGELCYGIPVGWKSFTPVHPLISQGDLFFLVVEVVAVDSSST